MGERVLVEIVQPIDVVEFAALAEGFAVAHPGEKILCRAARDGETMVIFIRTEDETFPADR